MGIEYTHSWNVEHLPSKNWARLKRHLCAGFLEEIQYLWYNNYVELCSYTTCNIQLFLDMFHCIGRKCSSRSMVEQACKDTCHRWYSQLALAILRAAKETKLKDIPDNASYDGMLILYNIVYCMLLIFCIHLARTVHCLEILLMKLKPKGVKDAIKPRMGAIICFADVTFFVLTIM